MNDRVPNDEDLLIDRLVDGELAGDERRELLAALDAQSDGWRKCALAFVEAQTWRSDMRQLLAPSAVDNENSLAPVCVPSTETAVVEIASASRKSYYGAWLAIAAALMVAFGLGRQLGTSEQVSIADIQNQRTQSSQLAEVPKHLPPELENNPAQIGDAVTLVVNDHRGVPQRVRVPLVEGRRLGQQFAETPEWSNSPELARQLNDHGLGLAARRRYAPMFFEQADQLVPMIVPVDDAIVTPVNRPVY
jgi:hypothetical protein